MVLRQPENDGPQVMDTLEQGSRRPVSKLRRLAVGAIAVGIGAYGCLRPHEDKPQDAPKTPAWQLVKPSPTPSQNVSSTKLQLPHFNIYEFPDSISPTQIEGKTSGPFDIPCAYYGRVQEKHDRVKWIPLVFKIKTTDEAGMPLIGYVHASDPVYYSGSIPPCKPMVSHPIHDGRPAGFNIDASRNPDSVLFPHEADIKAMGRQYDSARSITR